jgi:hypothetical protein
MAEDPNISFRKDAKNLANISDEEENAGVSDKIGEFAESGDSAGNGPSSNNPSVKLHIKAFKWHWVAVFAVAVIAIYLSLLNGVSLESALLRALYCTAIFWIIAEVVDWIIHKMQ